MKYTLRGGLANGPPGLRMAQSGRIDLNIAGTS